MNIKDEYQMFKILKKKWQAYVSIPIAFKKFNLGAFQKKQSLEKTTKTKVRLLWFYLTEKLKLKTNVS